MTGFVSFITGFCAVCIVTGGISIIAPQGSFLKPIKYVISLVFIAVVFGSVLSVEFPEIKTTESSGVKISETAVKINAQQIFSLALKNEGINFSKITVCTDKSEDGSISISEVLIYSNEDAQKIYSAVPITEHYKVSIINE